MSNYWENSIRNARDIFFFCDCFTMKYVANFGNKCWLVFLRFTCMNVPRHPGLFVVCQYQQKLSGTCANCRISLSSLMLLLMLPYKLVYFI